MPAVTTTPAAGRPRARAHVFIATSLDGFVARPDGALDWLQRAQAMAPAGEDFGYQAFFERMGALVLGRHSFETVAGFDPWPYGDKPVVVMSRRGVVVPAALQPRVLCSAEAPLALLQRLGREGCADVYVDGGLLVQAFVHAGLVDTLTLTTIPVLLGQGRRLWGALDGDVVLELLDSRAWPACGFVQSRYRVRVT